MRDIRVLDVSERVTGAHLGRLLAEQGAETVLVEPPDGNPLRERGPFAGGDRDPEKSLEFAHYHMNKLGVTADLTTPEGREALDRLAETADVLVADQPPDHPLREDVLDYDRLSDLNPGLIVTSITPYGLTGPRREYAADDVTLQAMGGIAQINGHPDRAPLRLPNNQAAHMGALNAMLATLGAVFYRDFNGGAGQLIDVSQQEAILIHLETHLQIETFDGYSEDPLFPGHHTGQRSGRFLAPGFGIFPCADGAVCIGAAQEHEVDALVEFFDTEELNRLHEEDKLYRGERSDHAREVTEAMEAATRQFEAQELERAGQDADIAVSMVKGPADLLEDEHFEYNGFIREVDHPAIGELEDTGPGARTRAAKEAAFTAAPLLGEHNEAVYGELGLDVPASGGDRA